jgi:hypothetical protein
MIPVRTSITEMVYHGPTPDIGDLWCHRVEHGQILTIFEPRVIERQLLVKGGQIVLWILTEPIPPVALEVHYEEWTKSIGEHGFKVIPELDDPERHKRLKNMKQSVELRRGDSH